MKVRIEIDTKTFIRFWLVVIGFAAAILALYSARTALVIIGTALFLALALNGPVSRLARYLPGRSRTLSTALSFLVVVVFLAMVIFLVIPPIVQQTAKFIDSAPEMVRTISAQWHGLGEVIEKYRIQNQVDQIVAAIQTDAARWTTDLGKNFISGLGSAFNMVVAGILVLVLTFLMLVEGPNWVHRLWSLYRNKERMEQHRRLVCRMHAIVSGYVGGQLTISAIDGFAAGATVFILSQFIHEVPVNLALPTVAICFTLSLIPVFGATIAGMLVAILLFFSSVPAGILFAIYFLVYQQVENNIIGPRIQSKRLELSPLTVLVSVTVGLYVFGVVGGVISIPIAGCINVLVEEYLEMNRQKYAENNKPLAKLVKKIKSQKA